MGLSFCGPAADALFTAETGAHEFIGRTQTDVCLIESIVDPMFKYEPPAGIGRARFFQNVSQATYSLRHRYDARNECVEDKSLQAKFHLVDGKAESIIAEAVEKLFEQQVQAIIDPWT